MRIRLVVLGLILMAFSLTLASPAAAQARGSWGVGYSFLGNNDIAVNSSSLPVGWVGNGAIELSDNLSIAFDVSGNYKGGAEVCGGVESRGVSTALQPAPCLVGVIPATAADEFQGFSNMRAEAQFCSPTLSTCDVKAVSIGGFVGPRFVLGSRGGVRPFVHIMGGVVRSVRKIGFYSHTSTNFAFMPGAGVDVPTSNDNISFRIQADMRRVLFGPDDSSSASLHTGGEDYNEIRVAFGIVIGVGG
ncbi:MAG: hypothetical protein ABGY72_15795 [bacterium]